MQVFFHLNLVQKAVFMAVFCLVFYGNVQAAPSSPWDFKFTGRNGISLSYQGVPIILKSTLYAFKPRWTGHLYNQITEKQEVRKDSDNSWLVTASSSSFAAQYNVRQIDEQTFQIHFRGELLKDVPAEIELNMGYFNSNVFLNRPYSAQVKTSKDSFPSAISGIVSSTPVHKNWAENNLAPNFESITLDSRVGKMTIKVLSETPVQFADARTNTNIKSPVYPVYWLGKTLPLSFGKPVEMTLTLQIVPLAAQPEKNISIPSSAIPVATAFVPAQEPLQVIPKPQKMELSSSRHFSLRNGVKWGVTAPAGELRLHTAVQNLLGNKWNLRLNKPISNISSVKDWCAIRIGDERPIAFPRELLDSHWAKQPDSYRLTVDANGIQIVAPTARGAFYGVQSLAQLMRSNGQAVTLPYTNIEDWPTLQFRGALLHPLGANVPFMKKLVDIIARHKYNHVVISGLWVKWDTLPEIAKPESISKDDLRELVKLCRDNFLEPIPLVNGPGHANWLIRNGHNLDLAEDSNVPQNYAVNNPKSLELVHKLMTELIEIFEPKIFHIGSDEVGGGRYPNPTNPYYREGETSTDLIVKNVRLQHAWLAERGIKTMMWGDMLLNKGEDVWEANAPSVEAARKGRSELPKDVIVADWQYSNSDKYPSLDLFQKEGLTTIATPWYGPLNIRNYTHSAMKSNAWGILQSTWHSAWGGSVESTFMEHARDYSAYFLGADYSWSGRNELPESLPYNSSTLFARELVPQRQTKLSGHLVDLDAAAQVTAEGWVGLGQGWDLAAFFNRETGTATRRFDNVDFRIYNRRFVVLSTPNGILSPEGALQRLTLGIGKKASEIAFLHTTLWNVEPTTLVASGTINYADGTSSTINFRNGLNITGWQGDKEIGHAMRVWQGKTPTGESTGLNVWRWINPHPEKVIASIELQPIDAHAGYALAGMTLIS